jgi:hypothetical protein
VTPRAGVLLARLLVVVDAAAIVLALALAANGPDVLASTVVALWLLVVSVVGGIIAVKRRDHSIGWLLLATGFCIGVAQATQEYAILALGERPGSLPFGAAAAWLSAWLPLPGFVAFALVMILFPGGRPRSRRGQVLVTSAVGLGVVLTLSMALLPGAIDGVRLAGRSLVENPLGIEPAGRLLHETFQVSGGVLLALGLGGVIARLVSFPSSSGPEREQLKWFVFAIGLVLATIVGNVVTTSTFAEEDVAYHVLAFFIPMMAVLAIPIAIGVAILRYRLYDIDVIINRALVYGALSVVLGSAYVLLVTVAGTLLGGSNLVTAAATLAVAALFRPFRRRLQDLIDRRFYRRKYDAARTLDAFSTRLRDEVDLEAMRAQLVTAARDAMEPSFVTVWLRH